MRPQCTLSLVHPMFGDVDYGELDEFDELSCIVDGKEQTRLGRLESMLKA